MDHWTCTGSMIHLNVDVDSEIAEDIHSLKQFDADMVVIAISFCLEAIMPELTLPKRLPPSMSSRLNIASNLAQHIKDLGFRGDMGYQTILYCNEVEVRRVLMFLIERLPREAHKTIPIEQTGYVPRIVKNIENGIKESLRQIYGIRELDNGYLVNSLGNSCPLRSRRLDIPDTKNNAEELKQYWIHNVPDVTRQCSTRELIPSLLFQDIQFSQSPSLLATIKKENEEKEINVIEQKVKISLTSEDMDTCEQSFINEGDGEEESVAESSKRKAVNRFKELEEVKTKYKDLQDLFKNDQLKLSQIRTMKNEEEEVLKDTLSKVKLKTKNLGHH
ncbi:hypothetical protein NQ317_011451 [Molorchus minor]|uniref:CCDC22 N-terminal domain-containing protein n=1 Tax=Molorchus minor TaxID=1323400 RepID=A0ABQ9IVQ9_9CUCU|nr:hypothetical protein NQ317_011451 [Molorchus minor]